MNKKTEFINEIESTKGYLIQFKNEIKNKVKKVEILLHVYETIKGNKKDIKNLKINNKGNIILSKFNRIFEVTSLIFDEENGTACIYLAY